MKKLNLLKKELIFEPGNQKFNMCHASNICRTRNGIVVAAWFAGDKEGSDDIAIWIARKVNGIWEAPIKTAHDVEEPHWNPVIYEKKDGELFLFYKVGRNISEWYTNIRKSKDEGKTWSEPNELVKGDRGGRGPVRCKVVTLSNENMIAGASTEKGIWTAYADYSSDGGKTWTLSDPIRINVEYHGENTSEDSDIQVSTQSFYGRGVIQPTIWESEQGKIHMLLRTTEEKIYRADSDDYGKNWSEAYETVLPNNNSGIDVAKCSDGTLILCSNPIAKNWGPRTPITLQISRDNGKTWKEEYVLENIPGEYSYPCIIADGDKIYVSYTYDRKSIAYCEFEYR